MYKRQDKDGNLIYLYANNKDEQYSYIEAATNKGYDVLLMDGQLAVSYTHLDVYKRQAIYLINSALFTL